MKFRTRTILGIALIEGVLLAILGIGILSRFSEANEQEIARRADLSGRLLAASGRDAMVASDLATIDAIATDVLATKDISYVRFVDAKGRVMVERGALPQRPPRIDTRISEVGDGIFDVEVPITVAGVSFGAIQYGIDIAPFVQALGRTRSWLLVLSSLEMGLVAVFSLVLGTYLTRQLGALRTASRAIAEGNFDQPLDVRGGDELAETARAFDHMRERIAESIARQKAIEADLRRAKEQADAANATKSRFLANVSHEIRTPVNGIIGMLRLLQSTKLDSRQEGFAESARVSSQSLLAILNDVLDISKIEAGRLTLEDLDFDLFGLLEELEVTMGARARAQGLAYAFAVAPGTHRYFRGDPERLRQVLVNLIGNALKFTQTGTLDVRVETVRDEADGVLLRFSVRDTGIGIPADKLDTIFESFTQVDASTTRKFGGTGLGLAICRQVVARMHGEIGVTSTVGQGSTFWFTARFRKLAGPPKQAEAASSSADALDFSGSRILLVEDNPVNQAVALAVLQEWGLAVDIAEDGAEAIQALRRSPYDLVLMDIQMPVLDGLMATRALRDPGSGVLDPAVPVVAMTAHALQEDRQRSLEAGMNDHLTKPLDPQALRRVLERHLRADRDPAAGTVDPAERLDSAADPDEAFSQEGLLQRLMGNRQAAGEVARAFLRDAPRRLEAIAAAVGNGDCGEAARALHALKGSLGSLQATPMLGRVGALERAANAGDLQALVEGLPGLEADFLQLETAIEDFLD